MVLFISYFCLYLVTRVLHVFYIDMVYGCTSSFFFTCISIFRNECMVRIKGTLQNIALASLAQVPGVSKNNTKEPLLPGCYLVGLVCCSYCCSIASCSAGLLLQWLLDCCSIAAWLLQFLRLLQLMPRLPLFFLDFRNRSGINIFNREVRSAFFSLGFHYGNTGNCNYFSESGIGHLLCMPFRHRPQNATNLEELV